MKSRNASGVLLSLVLLSACGRQISSADLPTLSHSSEVGASTTSSTTTSIKPNTSTGGKGAIHALALHLNDPVPASLIVTYQGLDWVWASPCALNGCTTGILIGKEGFNFATPGQWALRPNVSMFRNPDKCASPWFDQQYDHCDFGDPEIGAYGSVEAGGTGQIGSFSPTMDPYSETWLVRATPVAIGKPTNLMLKAGSVSPNSTGTHTMTWTAPGTGFQYTLQHKNTGGAYSDVDGSIPTNEKQLAEAEGTWTYQVKANGGAYSDPSAPVVVDKTAPTAPTVTVNGATPTGIWYKDSAAVAFNGSTDPALADTSAGSGVASYQGAQTFTTSGTPSYSGTATDAVGNVSAATTGSVKVDATAPSVAFASCPTSVILGTAQSLGWTASDGQSGLSSAASGSVTLPTSTVGPKTVTTTATDAVGHATTASCTVNVIYAFRGFLAPVDNLPIVNTAKAGSAVPLKFSLSGNQGLGILAAGSPTVTRYTCAAGAPSGDLGVLATFSNSGLQYDATSDTYNYVWKTSSTMVGCYQVDVKLIDGTSHVANFQLQ